jgi:hypothetical protein
MATLSEIAFARGAAHDTFIALEWAATDAGPGRPNDRSASTVSASRSVNHSRPSDQLTRPDVAQSHGCYLGPGGFSSIPEESMGKVKTIAGSTWPVLVFALVVLGAGLGAMAALTKDVTATAITALATAVLGVVGTHVGHVSGHELATKGSASTPMLAALEDLAQLHTNGKLTDPEFTAAKQRILDDARN